MEASDSSASAAVNAGESPGMHSDGRLATASCLKCGYSLRGLTENRCPECGTPFDPDLMARSYLPEWPRLMVWYLTAILVISLADLLSAMVPSVRGVSFAWMTVPLRRFPQPISLLVTFVAAPVAIVGLKRRVDWGRKAAVAMLFAQAVPPFLSLVGDAYQFFDAMLLRTPYHSLGGRGLRLIFMVERLLREVLPPALLAFLLWTGLRRRSLRRSTTEPHVMLLRDRFPPRGDWLTLMAAILVSQALADLAHLIRLLLIGFPGLLFFRPGLWLRYAFDVGRGILLWIVPGVWFLRIALQTWRDPGLIAGRLWRLLVFLAVAHAADQVLGFLLITPRSPSLPTTPIELVLLILRILFYLMHHLLLLLVLYYYASRLLPPTAIEQAKRPIGISGEGHIKV